MLNTSKEPESSTSTQEFILKPFKPRNKVKLEVGVSYEAPICLWFETVQEALEHFKKEFQMDFDYYSFFYIHDLPNNQHYEIVKQQQTAVAEQQTPPHDPQSNR